MSDETETEASIWPSYYAWLSGRGPRPLFVAALARFGTSRSVGRQAIDLGSGDGAETEALLREGWAVLAIDGEPDSKGRLEQRIPPELQHKLRIETLAFEEVKTLPPADFVYSGFSLPFCRPEAFPRLWSVITSCITSGGRIACDLFGDRDTWVADHPEWTFFTLAEAKRLFDGFELEQFDEIERDGEAFSGPKHWHMFAVIARKPLQRA